MAIKLYWSGGNRSQTNFGDSISPLIVEMLSGSPVKYADIRDCDMAAIGSILGKITRKAWKRLIFLRTQKIRIWGSGAFSPKNLEKNSLLSIHALRGQLTKNAMNRGDMVLGDPGLLIDRMDPQARRKYRWGIIPHISDRQHPVIQEIANTNDKSCLIDLTNPDLRETLGQIKSCDFIMSTSLHGLVTADALGIPNAWIRVSENDHTSDWKFLDYFSAIGGKETKPIYPGAFGTELRKYEVQIKTADPTAVELCKKNLETAFRGMNL